MNRPRVLFLGGLLIAAGCSTVAGIEDISDVEPAPVSDTATTQPPPATGAEAAAPEAALPVADGSVTPPADSGTVPVDAGADVPEVADASDDAPIVDDPPDPVGPGVPPGPACTAPDFAANDRRAANASRTIVLVPAAPGVPAQYQPRCMVIKKGQSVTWQGDFVTEPLQPRSQMPASPIKPVAAGNTATFTFPQKGRFRYGSAATPALRGVIDVRP